MPCADALSQKKREPLRRSANRRIVVKQLMVPKSSDSVLSSDPACYLFRGWSEWSFDFPRARSGAASIALFARTRRRSSACRGTSTTKTSPFASEKFKSATVGLSREIRVSADLASTRCGCLCGAIKLPYLGTGRLIICDLTRPGSAQLAQLVNTFLDLLPISPKRRQIFSKAPASSARSIC
jgi:hypothetical protein